MGPTPGMTPLSTPVSGNLIRFMEKVPTRGSMEGAMRATGKTIVCMAMALIPGQTVDVMRASTMMIKSMDTVYIFGKMDENMKDTGRMGNNTVKVNISFKMVAPS